MALHQVYHFSSLSIVNLYDKNLINKWQLQYIKNNAQKWDNLGKN